jgi:predicted enzyme related to lactoylglutathione lyase
VNWFEIPVTDLERAKTFYQSLLGIKLVDVDIGLTKMSFFPMMESTYGAAGALVKSKGYKPSQSGILVYFSVSNIDKILGKIIMCGGKTVLPKIGIGKYGYIAHFLDSEGHKVALHSNK